MAAFNRVAVIGAGTMGAGIAAQVANAGMPVLLLDIVPDGADDRSMLAEAALARLLAVQPAAFMHADAARRVTTGNIDDDLGKLAECDWIIEAVIERAEIKQALYQRVDQVRRPGCAVSSNTSTIPLATLAEGMSAAFRRDFLITHFFNPPRTMRLLEIVGGRDTSPDLLDAITQFAEVSLGKSVVKCNDTPGFIANRLGLYWMQLALVTAIEQGLTVEEADAILSAPMGVPRTGVFGLFDLIGIDLGPHMNASLRRALPCGDAFQAVGGEVPLVARMIAQGLTGRKGKGGFYRLERTAGERRKLALDLASGEYRPEQPASLPELGAAGKDLRALLSAPGKVGKYAFDVLAQTISYAASLVPEAAATPVDIDEAMRLGYAWKQGPFELADRIGVDWLVQRLGAAGLAVPPLLTGAAASGFYRVEAGRQLCFGLDGAYHDVPRAPGVLMLADIKRGAEPVLRNAGAALWEIGDGVVCFEFTGKANAIDDAVMALLGDAIVLVERRYRALVIYTDADHFSTGVDLAATLDAAERGAWSEVEARLATGQAVLTAMKYAPFPVVAAPAGLALGGACEIVLHCDSVQAHAELAIGLDECAVGLVPGWGGSGEMLSRWGQAPLAELFALIDGAAISSSAFDATDKRFLRATDGITMNRRRVLADAKRRALRLADGYAAPTPPVFEQRGLHELTSSEAGMPHDRVVADAVAELLSEGGLDEQVRLDRERQVFMGLLRSAPTRARIKHRGETGKALRN